MSLKQIVEEKKAANRKLIQDNINCLVSINDLCCKILKADTHPNGTMQFRYVEFSGNEYVLDESIHLDIFYVMNIIPLKDNPLYLSRVMAWNDKRPEHKIDLNFKIEFWPSDSPEGIEELKKLRRQLLVDQNRQLMYFGGNPEDDFMALKFTDGIRLKEDGKVSMTLQSMDLSYLFLKEGENFDLIKDWHKVEFVSKEKYEEEKHRWDVMTGSNKNTEGIKNNAVPEMLLKYTRMALAAPQFYISERDLETIILFYEKVREMGGEFDLRTASILMTAIEKKYDKKEEPAPAEKEEQEQPEVIISPDLTPAPIVVPDGSGTPVNAPDLPGTGNPQFNEMPFTTCDVPAIYATGGAGGTGKVNNKTFDQKEGYFNRHNDPLPFEECTMIIIQKDFPNGVFVHWTPYKKDNYLSTGRQLPSVGYLGTAETINGVFKGIGFHAWAQNDSEFIYYKNVNLISAK